MGSALFYALLWLDQSIDSLQHVLAAKAALAPLLLLFIEEAGLPLPVPGDLIIAYTGYRLTTHPNSPALWQAFVAAQLAALLGATVLFFISRRWGQLLILKLGAFIFLKKEHIKRAEALFARFGPLAIIFGRHIPGLRIPITVFAATSGVSYPVFLGSTFISTSAWILFYLLVGRRAGRAIHIQIEHYVSLFIIIVASITLLVFALHAIGIWRRTRKRGE